MPTLTSLSQMIIATAFFAVSTVTLFAVEPDAPIDFNRDVRPILADACLHCHGLDEESREADLQLDFEENATAERDGYFVVKPGQPERSELVSRILSDDEYSKMPPPESHRQLTKKEVETLKQWIAQGAPFAKHWSFISPEKPEVPDHETDWCKNEIDSFIFQKLNSKSIKPQKIANKRTLIRRVTLDLTGLPPTPEEVQQFLQDKSENAYSQLVDRLLASPTYGEQMAVTWMDLARYADSGGYQGDIPRTMWPWRDWVINAYNSNMPFDQFTTEQLAGDLLPNATESQIIATGFNRNHRVNDEDGIIAEEFRTEYAVDRLETTTLTWTVLTLGCARCHDHKFDPLSQKDFYSSMAYCNSVDEYGRGYGNTQPLYYFDKETRAIIERIDQELIDLGDAAQGEYQKLIDLKKERDEVLKDSLTTMVMKDLPTPRKTYVLTRGLYDKPGDEVFHGVPNEVFPLPADAPENRLGLAAWLLDPQHPLTARVAVNRYWQMHFGTGLVATPEDFGTRGEAPSHPELLDWLAIRFIESNWDVKAMHRLIVMSATYQQNSDVTKETYLKDPNNRLLARGPRVRMTAEMIRDQSLAAAQLIDDRIGGPSVKPYQPEGVWSDMVAFFPEYDQDHGRNLYRRSLYTYIRRTVQPPAMNALDFQSRETCQVRRATTNTPLQALVLMNDPTYIEAARVLATRTMLKRDEFKTDQDWITDIYERILVRKPTHEELKILSSQLQYHRNQFVSDSNNAAKFTKIGEKEFKAAIDPTEVAARTAIVSLVLNLDETLNRD